MNDYTFRIRFRIVDGTVLKEESTEREIAFAPGGPYTLHALARGQPIKESDWLVLKGPTFDNEKQARNAGELAKDALRWCSARLKMGIDVGQDKRKGVVTEDGKRWLKRKFEVSSEDEVLDDVHGLCVYKDQPGTKFCSAECKLTVHRNVKHFQDAFGEALGSGLQFKGELRIAFDLYSASHFLSVPRAAHSAALNRARFLTLWTALESLTHLMEKEDRRRSEEAIEHLRGFIARIKKSSLPADEKETLEGGLGALYNEPPKQLCQKLVAGHISDRQYGGMDACSFVSKCHKLRSTIMHGHSVTADDLVSACSELDKLVADLLIELGGRGCQT